MFLFSSELEEKLASTDAEEHRARVESRAETRRREEEDRRVAEGAEGGASSRGNYEIRAGNGSRKVCARITSVLKA